MTDELDDLYQAVILDHYKRPRNWGKPEQSDRHADGYNPLCGDRISVYLTFDGDHVREARADGSGCAISVASASMMTEALKGKSLDEVRELCGRFRAAVTGDSGDEAARAALGKLSVLAGVSKYPARVKCATLAWHTAQAALDDQDETITTE